MREVHISVNPDYAYSCIQSSMRLSHNAAMAGKQRSKTYLREWRCKVKGRTLAKVAAILKDDYRVKISQPQLGRIEVGKQPYSQDLLEGLAKLYNCSPADLISKDPNEAASEPPQPWLPTPKQMAGLLAVAMRVDAEDDKALDELQDYMSAVHIGLQWLADEPASADDPMFWKMVLKRVDEAIAAARSSP